MRKLWTGLLALMLCLALAACERPAAEAMDTFMTLTACGSHRTEALDAVEAEIRRLDALLSTGDPGSEISALNRTGSGVLSTDVRALVGRALELYGETGGRFDITVYPLMELWGFTDGAHRVPGDAEIAALLPAVDADQLQFDSDTGELVLGAGQRIDLGGIAKGYTSQRAMELYRTAGVTSGLVSLGGNVQCLGSRPDGTPWRIGIQDPWGADGAMSAVVEVVDQAVVTSGGYERYFTDEVTGVTYHHILDPATGVPARSGLASVTIVSPDGTLADGLSTALYIMGLDVATDYWRVHSGQFQAIFIDDAGKLYATEGLASSVKPTGGAKLNLLMEKE